MQRIAIINYNMGNLHSVARAVHHVAQNAQVDITSDADLILKADRIVFPGQGAARDCMGELYRMGLAEIVLEVAKTKPFLGICMGMQVLMQHSDENQGISCLGLYQGQVHHFAPAHESTHPTERLKIPQMGWNQVWQTQPHPLWAGIKDGARFYFVHSYYVAPDDVSLQAGMTDYGIQYTSALARDNVFAIQCHPEKSAKDGLQLLENFVNWSI
jgi:glutamine amidotransferase